MSEEEVIGFIREHIGSVYTLELLLLVKRDRHKSWTVGDLVRELRSSDTAVATFAKWAWTCFIPCDRRRSHNAIASTK